MFDHIQQEREAFRNRMMTLYRVGGEEHLEKAKPTEPIGAMKQFGGREYIKTASGWKYHGKGTGAKAKEHAQGVGVQKKHEEHSVEIVKQENASEKKVESVKESQSQIKTIAETEKALRLEKDGVQFWVQKKWFNQEKSQLTPAGEKSFEEAKGKQKDNEPVFNDNFKIVKDSDSGKASLIEAKIKANGQEQEIEFWVPKSQLEQRGEKTGIKGDFYRQKRQELSDKHSSIEAPKSSLETDKAIGYNIRVYENLSEQSVKRTLWFPKTQLKIEGDNVTIPKWLYEAKINEVYDSVKTGGWQYSSNSTFELEGLDQFKHNKVEFL